MSRQHFLILVQFLCISIAMLPDKANIYTSLNARTADAVTSMSLLFITTKIATSFLTQCSRLTDDND